MFNEIPREKFGGEVEGGCGEVDGETEAGGEEDGEECVSHSFVVNVGFIFGGGGDGGHAVGCFFGLQGRGLFG